MSNTAPTVMWLAKTSLSDGIAVLIVGTVLFLLLFGAVVLVRWVFRIICGRSAPEAVILVFPNACQEDDNETGNEDREKLENFTWFLHTMLSENQLGSFAEFSNEGEVVLVTFRGADANLIWKMIHIEAKDSAPVIPLRVILERSKKNGGKQSIGAIAWQPAHVSLLRPELPTLPEVWIRLSFYGTVISTLGLFGLFSWGMLRQFLKLSENEFRATDFGNYSAWIVGIFLIAGLCLKWISLAKIRSLANQAGFSTEESSTSTVLKYVLLLVILIFGLVWVVVV